MTRLLPFGDEVAVASVLEMDMNAAVESISLPACWTAPPDPPVLPRTRQIQSPRPGIITPRLD